MSNLLVRLLLSVILIVAAAVGYTICFILLEREMRDAVALLISNIIIGSLVMAGWIRIWLGQVKWTTNRRLLTLAAATWSIAGGICIAWLIDFITRHSDAGIVVGGMFWLVIWLASTVLVWRENAKEKTARLRGFSHNAIACPACGYNMTGLHQARCPECGVQYTLDELFSAMREDAVDLETEAVAAEHRSTPSAN